MASISALVCLVLYFKAFLHLFLKKNNKKFFELCLQMCFMENVKSRLLNLSTSENARALSIASEPLLF